MCQLLYFVNLPGNVNGNNRQQKENYTEHDCGAEEGFLNSPAGGESPTSVAPDQTAETAAFALQNNAGNQGN
jgi:hypothetical protein